MNKTQTYISEILLGDSFSKTLHLQKFKDSLWAEFTNFKVKSEDNNQVISIYKNDRKPFERCITRIRLQGEFAISREVKDESAESDLLEFIKLVETASGKQ